MNLAVAAVWFARWRKPLCKWMRSKSMAPPCDIEDLVQEVFKRLLRYTDDELVDDPQAYLFRIAANRSENPLGMRSMSEPRTSEEKVACRCPTDWCRLEPDNGAEHCPELGPNEFCGYETACDLCTPQRKCPDHGACVTDGEI